MWNNSLAISTLYPKHFFTFKNCGLITKFKGNIDHQFTTHIQIIFNKYLIHNKIKNRFFYFNFGHSRCELVNNKCGLLFNKVKSLKLVSWRNKTYQLIHTLNNNTKYFF